MKKTWEAPKLIILARSRPEESLLVQCKTAEGFITGPFALVYFCAGTPCTDCSALADS
jgi:hypothetical protein